MANKQRAKSYRKNTVDEVMHNTNQSEKYPNYIKGSGVVVAKDTPLCLVSSSLVIFGSILFVYSICFEKHSYTFNYYWVFIVVAFALTTGVYIMIRVLRRRIIIETNINSVIYVPTIGRAIRRNKEEISAVIMDVSKTRIDIIDTEHRTITRLTDDMQGYSSLERILSQSKLFHKERINSDDLQEKIENRQKVFCIFSLISLVLLFGTLPGSYFLSNIMRLISLTIGLVLFAFNYRYYSIKTKNKREFPSLYVLTYILMTVEFCMSSILVNTKSISLNLIVAGLVLYCFIKSGYKIYSHRLVVALCVIVLPAIIVACASFVTSTVENVPVTIDDKYYTESNRGIHLESFVFVVSNEDDDIDQQHVKVTEETFNKHRIGETIELLRHTSLVSAVVLVDPKIEQITPLAAKTGNVVIADAIVVCISLILGICLSITIYGTELILRLVAILLGTSTVTGAIRYIVYEKVPWLFICIVAISMFLVVAWMIRSLKQQ